MSMLFSSYGQNIANKYNQKMELYRNDMRKIQEGHTQNSITTQELYDLADTKRQHLANEIEYMDAAGTLTVQQAVSGFDGRTSRAISNATLRAKKLKTTTIEEQHERSRRRVAVQRLNTAMGTQLSLEDGWVQPVNWLASLTGDAASVFTLAQGSKKQG